jgi:hypothetical protein
VIAERPEPAVEAPSSRVEYMLRRFWQLALVASMAVVRDRPAGAEGERGPELEHVSRGDYEALEKRVRASFPDGAPATAARAAASKLPSALTFRLFVSALLDVVEVVMRLMANEVFSTANHLERSNMADELYGMLLRQLFQSVSVPTPAGVAAGAPARDVAVFGPGGEPRYHLSELWDVTLWTASNLAAAPRNEGEAAAAVGRKALARYRWRIAQVRINPIVTLEKQLLNMIGNLA